MNNDIDGVWFGHRDAFTVEGEGSWEPCEDKVVFPKAKGRGWQAYVKSSRLEITCGEAPYLCSRYDAVDGEAIPIERRMGLLDRKLRVASERTKTHDARIICAFTALKATYGYEYQGDNLLIARTNVLETFVEYAESRWGMSPSENEVSQAAEIISWNLWQMDGLTCAVPASNPEAVVQLPLFEEPKQTSVQMSMFDMLDDWEDTGGRAEEELGKDAQAISR